MPNAKPLPARVKIPLPQPGGYHTIAEREIDSRFLRHFLAVVECKGFTAAAEALNLTQPGLTKSIQKLEQILGVKLLERHHKSVEPTAFGEVLAARARLIELELAHALSEIESMKGGLVGTINVGVGPSFINYVSEVVLAMQVHRPNVRVNVSVDVMDTLLTGLISGTFDIICTSLEFPSYPEIAKEALSEGEHFVVSAADHALQNRGAVNPKDLLAYPWVAFSKDNMGIARMGSVFAVNRLRPPNITTTTNSAEVMFDLVRKSNYLASIPSSLLPNALGMGLAKLPVKGALWQASLGIAYRKTAHVSAPLNAFINACRKIHLPAP
ncbi:MAG: LysR family transcriptional regulator [Alphaproteobacteria bacterium]|nr:LysR family transcriptional regulator [Alphaproteobacteria bacterium]MDE2350718.1 LysR family transcriptional regulator [Alphaproteobacteria bacterium]